MKKKHIVIFLCAVLIVAAALVFLLKKNDWFFKDKNKSEEIIPGEKFSYTPVMYKICDDDNCNYLIGSMHLGDAHINDLSDKVLNAYKEMDALAVEVDITDYKINLENYLLPEGVTIDTLVSKELNDKLEDFSSKHILFPYEQYKSYKLGFVSELLSSVIYYELGYMTEGVDSYFLKLANDDKKEIISIETIESQEAFYNDYSNELYIFEIEDTIDNYNEQTELIKKLYDAYLAGDAEELKKIINSENQIDDSIISEKLKKELETFEKAMFDDRNIVMASAIESYLKDNKNVFVTVGAAHVVSDNGIVDILKEKGYKITQMN